MIGTRLDKPLQPDELPVYEWIEWTDAEGKKHREYVQTGTKPNPAPNTFKKYAEEADWCNHNDCHIEDKESFYETVKNEPIPPQPTEPTEFDKLQAQTLYTAVMTDTLIEE